MTSPWLVGRCDETDFQVDEDLQDPSGWREVAAAFRTADDRKIGQCPEAGARTGTAVGRAQGRPTAAGNLTVAGSGVDDSRFEWRISRVAGSIRDRLRTVCGR